MKRKIKVILILSILIIVYTYVANITLFPKNILLMQGEKLNLATLWGIKIVEKENSNPNIGMYQGGTLIEASTTEENQLTEMGKIDLSLNLFSHIPMKEVSINVIPKTTVIPLGNAIGLKLYTEGVLIVGMSEIDGKKPYENTGIKEGDRIISVDNIQINSTEELIETVNHSKGKEVTIQYMRENAIETTSMVPVQTKQNDYKLGLWVRDAAAGVGTASFYVPSTNMFACLGHGITDIDTEELITISNGELVTTDIVSVQKGEKGKPGEIRGSIESGITIGEIAKNTNFGIFGKLTNKSRLQLSSEEIEVANRSEIKTGKAQIICELEQGNKKTYEIEIQKIYINNNKDNKSMQIKVTDKELLEKTGGIIQRNVWFSYYTKWKASRNSNSCVSQ